jgi:hypothetical protein
MYTLVVCHPIWSVSRIALEHWSKLYLEIV